VTPASVLSSDLTADELAGFALDGFLIRRSVFRPDEVAALRDAVERAAVLAAKLSETGRTYLLDGNRFVDVDEMTIQFEHTLNSETIRVIEPVHQLDARLGTLVDDPRIVQPMRGLVGCDYVALWTDKLNLKRPREGSLFRWHQDSPYWSHACDHVDRLPNVLMTLDDADEDNGCFRVIRGSHADRYLPGLGDGSRLGPLFTDPRCFDEADQAPAVVPAGSLVFFSPHTVHGSQPNRSDAPRRALVLTYQPGGNRMFKVPATRNAGEPLSARSLRGEAARSVQAYPRRGA